MWGTIIARGNHFRTVVCLDSLDMLICCTGTGLLVEEQKMAETVFSWLDDHWISLALGCTCLPTPGGIYLWEGFWIGFLLGQTCEVPVTARGNHFKPFACLDSLDMFICCTGTGLLLEEQKMAETVFSWLDCPWNSFVCHYSCFQWGKFLPTNLPRLFGSKSNEQPTRDFAASCDTTCKSHCMCASGDGKRSKHAKNKLKKPCIAGVNAKVKVQLTTSKLSWTHKFPQSEMFSPCTEIKKQTEFVNFSTVYLYIILLGFCAEWHLVRQYCCDIVRSSLVNHQNHSLNRRIKLANCFQPPAH